MNDRPSAPEAKIPERLDAEFLTSAPSLRHAPPADRPEVAFAGRSNAGKSSVLNRLTGHRQMAKVSKTPGRTQLLNFFDLKIGGRFVDLPGYGYAKAGRDAQATWQRAVNDYLSNRETLVGLVLVMDIRHPNQALDQELIEWSHASELNCCVLLNKADKLGFSKQKQAQNRMIQAYSGHDRLTVQPFSALKGAGKAELIERLCGWFSRPGA